MNVGVLVLKSYQEWEATKAWHEEEGISPYNREEVRRNLAGVAAVAQAQYLQAVLGENIAVVQSPNSDIGYQDWAVFFPYSFERMEGLLRLLPDSVALFALPDALTYRHEDSECADTEEFRKAKLCATMYGVEWAEGTTEAYEEAPTFTEAQAEACDRILRETFGR